MAEQQVTIDNDTYALDELFMVIATPESVRLSGHLSVTPGTIGPFFVQGADETY